LCRIPSRGFLVRFPKLKIAMATLLFFYPLKFKMPAYWLLRLWLVAELFYGSARGQFSPVAHWAHVGGFLFGMLGANVVRRSGLVQQANEAIESELGWMSNPDVVGGGRFRRYGPGSSRRSRGRPSETPDSKPALHRCAKFAATRATAPPGHAYLQATSGLGSEYQDGDSGRREASKSLATGTLKQGGI
jgi:hypothetical protein